MGRVARWAGRLVGPGGGQRAAGRRYSDCENSVPIRGATAAQRDTGGMDGAGCAYGAQDVHQTHKVRLGRLAGRQFGQVSWAQLRDLGVAPATVRRWVANGYLIPVVPRVYAVGHHAGAEHERLFSLVLFAGPGAALSHLSAAYRRGWVRYAGSFVHVSTPRQVRGSLAGVRLHCRRSLEREFVGGIPCTTVIQTLVDLAASESPALVDRALAQLDYQRVLDPGAIRAVCARGRPGSAALAAALGRYIPAMAVTRSELEDAFLRLCARHGIPTPAVNAVVCGLEVDAYWPDAGLVAELDGAGNHSSGPQRNRDQRRALRLRAAGIEVVRYTHHQVTREGPEVAADLMRGLACGRGPARGQIC